jgi:hypothetical protein
VIDRPARPISLGWVDYETVGSNMLMVSASGRAVKLV